MEPINATQEAVDEYGPFSYRGGDLLQRLGALSEQVEHEVPSCVGLSLSLREVGATFTLVASDKHVAVLDAVQYVDGGPCVDAFDAGVPIAFLPDHRATPDRRWGLFSRAATTVGIRSTLSLPVLRGGLVSGGFNLYASTAGAFDGHHDVLAEVLGAWSGGAVTDADLGFVSREVARRAPALLRVETRIIVAANLLERVGSLTHDLAEQRLRDAAVRAGVPLAAVIDTVIHLLGASEPESQGPSEHIAQAEGDGGQ